MTNFICQTCGAQFAATDAPPEHCPICEDERQYVGHDGQQWTTLERLRQTHHGVIRLEEPGLTGIGTEPEFAIGQRALLVQSAGGNVMWDGVPLLNDAMLEAVRSLGGLRAITGSHPHLYSTMVDWAHAFDAPIYLPASDRDYVMRPDKSIHYWHGDTLELGDGVTVIRCGGHFDGSSVLHWANGADGRGALLTGDTITVVQDRRFVSFMRSYPNLIPLDANGVQGIVKALEPYPFDRLYNAWFGGVVAHDAKNAVFRSAQRYLRAIGADVAEHEPWANP
jgi:hypothetical protein